MHVLRQAFPWDCRNSAQWAPLQAQLLPAVRIRMGPDAPWASRPWRRPRYPDHRKHPLSRPELWRITQPSRASSGTLRTGDRFRCRQSPRRATGNTRYSYYGPPSSTSSRTRGVRIPWASRILQQLRGAGITVDVDPEPYPNGRFARLHDPEGNPIELWQPRSEERRVGKEGRSLGAAHP